MYRNVKVSYKEIKGTVFAVDSTAIGNPFAQYLNGKAPVITKEISDSVATDVQVTQVPVP